MFVYDIGDEKSFQNITAWLESAREHSSDCVVRMLIGTKCDIGNQRKISYEQGNQLAHLHEMIFFETSAKTNEGIEEAFVVLARDVKEQIDGAPAIRDPAAAEESEVRACTTRLLSLTLGVALDWQMQGLLGFGQME